MSIFSVFLVMDRLNSFAAGYVKRDSNQRKMYFEMRNETCEERRLKKTKFSIFGYSVVLEKYRRHDFIFLNNPLNMIHCFEIHTS